MGRAFGAGLRDDTGRRDVVRLARLLAGCWSWRANGPRLYQRGAAPHGMGSGKCHERQRRGPCAAGLRFAFDKRGNGLRDRGRDPMGRAFSPYDSRTAVNLGRWPRLVWGAPLALNGRMPDINPKRRPHCNRRHIFSGKNDILPEKFAFGGVPLDCRYKRTGCSDLPARRRNRHNRVARQRR